MDPDLGRYPTRLGRGRPADRGLRGAAGHPAHPGQRDRRADHRGAARRRHRGRPHAARTRGDLDRGLTPTLAMAEPRNATITYPGGLRARWRWGGSGQAAAVFALSEAGGDAHRPRAARQRRPRRPVPSRAPPRGSARRVDGPLRLDHPRRAARPVLGHGRPAGRGLRVPHVRAGRGDRRRPLGPPIGDADRRPARVAAARATSSSSPRSRRSPSSPTGRSAGGSPIPTS